MTEPLISLGLSPFFSDQLTAVEQQSGRLARIIEVQRGRVTSNDGVDDWNVVLGGAWYELPPERRPTVGDWVVLDEACEKITRLLERKSVFTRIAAGSKVDLQLIAANVDTLFIVTSCNDDFNESRLERYLALAVEANVEPVIVITKIDLVTQPSDYLGRVRAMNGDVAVKLVDAREPAHLSRLEQWIIVGSTVALVGSSGVGKSTIVNSLSGERLAETAGIREQDSRGRHTTSYRSLHRLASGGLLLDVPGFREVKLAQLETSLDDVFEDVEELAQQCKFSNCGHAQEPGCAVRVAIADGQLDERRLHNYQKLVREEVRNTATLSAQRHRDRQFSKTVKQHIKSKRRPSQDD